MFPGFLFLLAWLLLPPVLVAALALTRLRRPTHARWWKEVVALLVLSTILEILFVVAGPAGWGKEFGVRDTQVFGLQVMWAPFAWMAVALAWLAVFIWSARMSSR